MKAILSSLAFTTLAAAAAVPFTYETPTEFSATGDWNGDGHPDVAVLDRGTASIRILGSLSGVSFLGTAQIDTGLIAPDSLSSNALSNGQNAIAVGASSENKAILIYPSDSRVLSVNVGIRNQPGAVLLTGPYPGQGAGPVGNLFLTTDLNLIGTRRQITRYGIFSTGFPSEADSAAYAAATQPGAARRGNPLPWESRTALGYLMQESGASSFTLFTGTANPRDRSTTTTGLPAEALWAAGDFASTSAATGLLFYQRNSTTFTPREVVPNGGDASFTSFPEVDLGAPIHLLITVSRNGADFLLALFDEGTRAVLYDYGIGTLPTATETWNAPAGEKFTQAAALGDGSLVILSGTAGISRNWQRYDRSGHRTVPTLRGTFRCGLSGGGGATLFQFDSEPFVTASAKLRKMTREGDWTDLSGNSSSPVAVLADLGPEQGLGQPNNFNPNSAPLVTITNQFTRTATGGLAPISFSTLSRLTGTLPATIRFDPPAGLYPSPVGQAGPDSGVIIPGSLDVTLSSASSSTAGIAYRLAPDALWQTYTAPIELTTALTIEARFITGTRVFSSTYTFGSRPATDLPLTLPDPTDVNQNGLPDSWETAFAQSDPAADSDGDGRSAIQEYQDGTDPRDVFSANPGGVTDPADTVESAKLELDLKRTVSGGKPVVELSYSILHSDAMLQSSDDLKVWKHVTTGMSIRANEILHTAILPGSPSTGSMIPARQFYRLTRVTSCP